MRGFGATIYCKAQKFFKKFFILSILGDTPHATHEVIHPPAPLLVTKNGCLCISCVPRLDLSQHRSNNAF
jgi:hypothetical protein